MFYSWKFLVLSHIFKFYLTWKQRFYDYKHRRELFDYTDANYLITQITNLCLNKKRGPRNKYSANLAASSFHREFNSLRQMYLPMMPEFTIFELIAIGAFYISFAVMITSVSAAIFYFCVYRSCNKEIQGIYLKRIFDPENKTR